MDATTAEAQITGWLATQQQPMIDLLCAMVDIDSGSYHKPGIDAVGAVLERFFSAHGIAVERLPQAKHGDCLRAIVAGDSPTGNAGGNIVLMGHRDTVYPLGEVTRRPFVTDVVINTDYDPSRMQDHLFVAPSLPFLRRELEGLVRRFGIPVL